MRYYATVILFLFFASCDKPCTNINPIFDTYKPLDREYQIELAHIVDSIGKENLVYLVVQYHEQEGREYMFARVQGGTLCTTIPFDITGNEQLENYRRVKGVSYGGRILGLEYSIVRKDSTVNFVFKDYSWIAD